VPWWSLAVEVGGSTVDRHVTTSDPLIGTELGDFRPVALLGKGGMGAVYEAEDLALHRRVALKVLLPEVADDNRARARFQREIDHAVAIEHPHVVPVYTAGFERPHFYISMRLVPGPDLARIVRDGGALEQSRALRILGQVASALHAVHTKGLVHRDIKPHNVLLWEAGSDEEHAMLTDFGIAKALDDTHSLTGLAVIGTAGYMAPEIALGHLATPACDQYSLGCMAYELLSGHLPFEGDAAQLRTAHVEQAPVPLSRAAPHVSSAVADAVDIALAKDPTQRHADVRAFVRTAKASHDAFRRSEAITRVMTEAARPEEAVGPLSAEHGLSDVTISQLTDLDRTQVVRLRRRQARHALVGRRPS
jgi:serine/threonine protein kinase